MQVILDAHVRSQLEEKKNSILILSKTTLKQIADILKAFESISGVYEL